MSMSTRRRCEEAAEQVIRVDLRRLPARKRERLAELMDKNSEGALNHGERAELQQLAREVEELLLDNSETLARAVRPELFDKRGRRVRSRFRQALSHAHPERVEPKHENGRA